MRNIVLATVICLTLLDSCGLSDNRESKVHSYLQQRIASESKGAIKLDNFKKTNGFDQNIGGMKIYILEWQAEISIQQEIWKSGNAFVGYWESFGVRTSKPGNLEDLMMASSSKHFNIGAKIRLTGNCNLQKTEQGWRVEDLSVKTSQLLNNDESRLNNSQENEYGATHWDSVIKSQPSSRAYSARASLFRKDANKFKDEADKAKNQKNDQEANLKYAEANKNYQQAIDYYTEAIKLNAIDHESYNNRANIYMDQNKLGNAIVDYKQALIIKPDYYVALDNMGAVYARRGMYDSALYYFTKVLEQKPDYKPTYSNRAITFMGLKRYDEAIKDWQRFLGYQPNDPDVTNTIGLCYRMLGKNQEALGFINTAIRLDPQASYFLNRSYTYKNLNNIENARSDALTAKKAGIQVDAAYAASLGIQ